MDTQDNPDSRDSSPNPGNSRTTRQQKSRTRRDETKKSTKPSNELNIEEETEDRQTPEPQVEETIDFEGPIRNVAFPTYKLLRRQHLKLTTARHHVEFLSTLKSKNQAPKGLKPKTTLTTTELGPRLYIRWEQAHIELAYALRDILKDHWQETANNLEEDVSLTHRDLKEICTEEEMTSINSQIAKVTATKKIELSKRRTNKERNTRRGGTGGSAAENP